MKKFKKSTFFTVVIIIAVIGVIASIMISSYCDYMPRAKWAKAIATIGALKLAISECLLDNEGDQQACNSVAALDKYGIKAMPVLDKNAGKVEISAIDNHYPLAILISGNDELEHCQFAFIPTLVKKEVVSWNVFFIDSADANEKKCLANVKGSKSLSLL